MKSMVRVIIDAGMVVLLPLLMAYSLIGEMFHEIAGSAMLVLLVVHNILNRRWYGALFKGRYGARRIFQTALDAVLFLFLLLQPVSGILISKHLYTFLPTLNVSAAAREIHLIAAYWGIVLASLHAGTHLTAVFGRLKKKKALFAFVCAIAAVVSAYGVRAFIKRGFPGYMFGTAKFAFFDFEEPVLFFIADYLAVMVLFAFLGCALMVGMARIDKGSNRSGRDAVDRAAR